MNDYQKEIKQLMNEYVHKVYKVSKTFPNDEMYGARMQLRRAAMSVVLNYIEGVAIFKPLVKINFFETSYGSLQESKYVIEFSKDEGWIIQEEHESVYNKGDRIGGMLWTEISNFKNKYSKS